MERRKTITKIIGLNYGSKHIPMMLDVVDRKLQSIEINKEINIGDQVMAIFFEIISTIIFGEDINKNMKEFKYIDPKTGEVSYMPFHKFYGQVFHDGSDAFYITKGQLLPFLRNYKLCEPYRTNGKNYEQLIEVVQEFSKHGTDKDSIFYQLMDSGKFTKHECTVDSLVLLFAGYESTSFAVTFSLYQLQKNPAKYEKLQDAIKHSGLHKMNSKDSNGIKDMLENCDYLTYVFKESLRLNPALPCSLIYHAKEDIKIGGVDIPKGGEVDMMLANTHYNTAQWRKPTEFIPERFDQSSESFFKPGSDKEMRHPKSFIGFGYGARGCIGQSLAKIQGRVILTRLLTHAKIQFNDKEISDEHLKLNVLDSRPMMGKFIEVKTSI